MKDGKDVVKRFKAAQKRKANWDTLYRDVFTYAAPNRETFFDYEPGVNKQQADKVFDSTALSAVQKFASNMQSALVPPMKKWVNLVPGDQIPEDQKPAASKQLEKIRDTAFTHIHNSNFDVQISESLQDLAAGTGALLALKGTDAMPLNFVSVPLSQLVIERGGRSAFRNHKEPVREITHLWPDAKLTPELKDLLERNPDKEVKLIDATIEQDIEVRTRTQKGADITKTISGYRYVVVEEKTQTILVDREQRSSPWIIFRWSVLSGEDYGRGPLVLSLADIKTINKTKELILKNASIKTSGAWTVADDGIININNIRIRPGAKIPVSANPGSINGPTIAPLAMPGDFNVAQLVLQDLRNSINEMMFTNPFGSLDLPVRTATEMMLRQQELAKQIGSSFGRLMFEMVTPLFNRVLFLLEEMGKIDLNDFRVDGEFIAVQHISPLAMAQDQEELTAMLRYAEILTGTFGPQVALLLLKPDQFSKKAGEFLNIPADIVPTPAEFEQMKQMLGQMVGQGAAQQGQPTA